MAENCSRGLEEEMEAWRQKKSAIDLNLRIRDCVDSGVVENVRANLDGSAESQIEAEIEAKRRRSKEELQLTIERVSKVGQSNLWERLVAVVDFPGSLLNPGVVDSEQTT